MSTFLTASCAHIEKAVVIWSHYNFYCSIVFMKCCVLSWLLDTLFRSRLSPYQNRVFPSRWENTWHRQSPAVCHVCERATLTMSRSDLFMDSHETVHYTVWTTCLPPVRQLVTRRLVRGLQQKKVGLRCTWGSDQLIRSLTTLAPGENSVIITVSSSLAFDWNPYSSVSPPHSSRKRLKINWAISVETVNSISFFK